MSTLPPPKHLSLTPLTSSSIPNLVPSALEAFKSQLLASASSLISSVSSDSPTWKSGSTYNKSAAIPTKTLSSTRPPGSGATLGYKWHARRSTHKTGGIEWDEVREALLVEHSTKEAMYIESCKEASRIEIFEEGVLEVWQMSYKLPFPTSNRDFVILIYTVETTPASPSGEEAGPRSFLVVSIPFDHPDAPPRKQFCRGKYVSVEELKEETRGGDFTWTMATASDPAGLVPKWITELAMPSKISEDVPSLMDWIKKQRPAKS